MIPVGNFPAVGLIQPYGVGIKLISLREYIQTGNSNPKCANAQITWGKYES